MKRTNTVPLRPKFRGTLIFNQSRKPVKIGDEATTFRGEKVVVTGIHEPHKPQSTGRVAVRYGDDTVREFFPGVIGASWINRNDQV
jgi:hypothetical protein